MVTIEAHVENQSRRLDRVRKVTLLVVSLQLPGVDVLAHRGRVFQKEVLKVSVECLIVFEASYRYQY